MLSEPLPNSTPALSPEKIAAQSRSNFTLSFFFLPHAKRAGITNFYALSRVIDDAVDDHPPGEAKALLQFWQQEVALCYGGHPTHPVTQAMQGTIQRFQIPKKYLDLLLEGCEWDLSRHRYANLHDLNDYCYRVAGIIGLTSMKIFEVTGPEAEAAAVELGLALQLTNIVRDVIPDAKLGRIYLPQDLLREAGVSDEAVLSGTTVPGLDRVFATLLTHAETHFAKAFALMARLPRRPLIAAWIMGRVYYGIFQKIKNDPLQVMQKKVSLSKISKLSLVISESARALF